MKRDYQHGPTSREQRIIDLTEQDWTPEAIAEDMGLKVSYVTMIVNTLVNPPLVDWQRPARAASANLLRAIARHHPEKVSQ